MSIATFSIWQFFSSHSSGRRDPLVLLRRHFGIGVGTLVLTINVTLLSLYTFHAIPFVICRWQTRLLFLRVLWPPLVSQPESFFSFLNERHMLFAWCSLVSVVSRISTCAWSPAAPSGDMRLL